MSGEQESKQVSDQVETSSDETGTRPETAEDAVIGGDKKEHQELHNQALESNPDRHSGSANLDNPDNNDESIQLIDAGTVVAERNKRRKNEAAGHKLPGSSYIEGLKRIKSGDHVRHTEEYIERKAKELAGKAREPVAGEGNEEARGLGELQETVELPGRDGGTHKAIETVDVEKGDSLWSIASKKLGKKASNGEIDDYVKQLAKVNKIENPDKIYPGQTLATPEVAPAINRDIAEQASDKPVAGESYTVRKGDTLYEIAGRVLGKEVTPELRQIYIGAIAGVNGLSNPNNLSVGQKLRIPEFEIETFESGPDAELDARQEDIRPEAERKPQEKPDVTREVEKVDDKKVGIVDVNNSFLTLARKHGIDTDNLKIDLKLIEQLVKKGDVSAEQIEKTYRHVERLLETESKKGVSEGDRKILAQQIVEQTADPTRISQGFHNTCQVTAVECRAYTRTPSHAARLVADLALTGEYTALDGSKVRIKPEAVGADARDVPSSDGSRSYASELFQVCAVNLHYVKEGKGTRYVQERPKRRMESTDTGERLFKKGKKEAVAQSPELDDNALVGIYNAITGESRDGFVFCHKTYVAGSEKGLSTVSSEAELLKRLQSIPSSDYPVIVGVHTANEPFWSDSDGGEAGGAGGESGGGHFITVRGLNPGPPPTVVIDNQWNKEADHAEVPLHKLYLAMQHPNDSCKQLQKDVQKCRDEGRVDAALEFELIHLQLLQEPIKPEQLANLQSKAISMFRQQCQRWQAEQQAGKLDLEEQQTAVRKFKSICACLPYEGRIQLYREQERGGFMSHQQYVAELTEYGRFTSKSPTTTTSAQNEIFTRLLAELPAREQSEVLSEILGS